MGLSDRSIDYPLLTAAMAPALERIRRDCAQAPGSIQPAFDHLLDNLCASALKSKSLLEVSGVVRNRFAERFQQVTGMQPRAYIESLRIEIACRLLQHPRIPILTIGMCLGWDRRAGLTEVFRRVMGTTPTVFRRAASTYSEDADDAPPSASSAVVRDKRGRPGIEQVIDVVTGLASTEDQLRLIDYLDRELIHACKQTTVPRAMRERDRAVARSIWRSASTLGDTRRKQLLASAGVIVPEVFELLFEKTRTEGRQDRRRGVSTARLVLATIDQIPADALSACALGALHVRAFAWLGNAHRLACDFAAAEDAFVAAQGVLALLAENEASVARAEFLDRRASLRWFQGRFDEAHELASEAACFRSACHEAQQMRMALQMASIEAAQGDLAASCATLEGITQRIDHATDDYLALCAWVSLTLCYLELGQWSLAERALARAKDRDGDASQPDVLRISGLLAHHRGELSVGLRDLEQARDGFVAMGDRYFAAVVALEGALAAVEARSFARAAVLAKDVLVMLEDVAEPHRPIAAIRILASCGDHQTLARGVAAALTALKDFGRNPLNAKRLRTRLTQP